MIIYYLTDYIVINFKYVRKKIVLFNFSNFFNKEGHILNVFNVNKILMTEKGFVS